MRRTSPWRSLLAAFLLLALAEAGRADEFSAVEHQRQTIYHSPQTPGYTCWVGAWIMPDGDLMTCFTQATGPAEGRPKAPREVMELLSWYPQYDMTGLDLHNVHLRSSDAGQTWKQVSADPFKTCMNGVTGEAQSVLPDGTIVRGVFGLYLPFDKNLPKTGFLQRSTDGTKTWGKPEVLLDPEKTTVWPRRIRTLRDGRVLLLLGVSPLPAGKHTRREFSNRLEPTILISSDQGRTWSKPLRAAPEDQITGFTEEFDVAELDNGDLLTIYRRIDDAKRWQGILKKADGTWIPGKVGPIELPHSGQPELLKTLQGPVLHIATSGIHWTSDAGQTWNKLNVPGTPYYPRSVQAKDGRIFVFGHVGGDDAYGKVDQSIVMDSFLLKPKTAAVGWKMHNVRRLAGGATEQQIPARLQIVTENWNRVVAVPYIVYMPEKDRLLMLVSCDYPHRPMVLTSDDHGASWSQPQLVLPDEPAHARHLLGVSLTYLGDGQVLCGVEGKLRCRSIDYGQTWTSEPIPPNSHGGGWNQWDPYLVDLDTATGKVIQLMETGYRGSTDGGQEAFLRSSRDLGKSWNDAARVPQWAKVSEVALARATNGHIVAACRTDIPQNKQGETLDHFEGLGISISPDEGHTWSEVQKLFDWGRHHPSVVVMPTGEIVMTYVVRKGYIETEDAFPQFGIEAIVSRDHGQTWDLDHRYLLHTWVGNRKGSNQNAPGPQAWWASSQATSTVLLPDGNLLTAFGTGYRSQPNAQGMSSPRDVGLIQWQLSKEPAWEMAKALSLEGLEISLSKPRLVARSQGYLWFPTMTRLSGGELCANFSTNLDAIVADRTSSVSWSADDGLTWSEPSSIMPKGDLYAETMLRLKNGDEMLLPFNLYPDGEAMRGWHQIVSGKKGERKVTFTDKSITVSGWPRPDRSFNEELGLSGFGFNGHGIMGESGEYLATMYGFFKDERRYSLVMVESTDGLAWRFRSPIASFDCPLAGGEGPCESQTVRLKDGRLMNIFRLASNVPYGQTFSDDDGRTWLAPVAMQDAHSVQPSLAIMRDGSIVLTGGRPGIFAWINFAGDGKDWLQVDLQSHHNENHALDAITRADQTTSYTEVVALDEQSVIVIYDHIPHGWNAIPNDSQDTNSIWVVKLAWKAK